MSLIRSLTTRAFTRRVETNEVFIERAEDIGPWLFWASKSVRLRLYLPIGLLRMHGGFGYQEGRHPMVRAVTEGPEILSRFYAAHQPASLAEAHWIEGVACSEAPMALPWIGQEAGKEYRGEKGLDASHGISYFGPCSEEKIALEHRRLSAVARSIRSSGYDPNAHGDIEGMFLRDGDDFRFFVRGGKHRAAALAALGHRQIPVTFKPHWPRVVDVATCGDWPMVRAGRIDVGLAREVLRSYFRLDGREQLARIGLGPGA